MILVNNFVFAFYLCMLFLLFNFKKDDNGKLSQNEIEKVLDAIFDFRGVPVDKRKGKQYFKLYTFINLYFPSFFFWKKR